MRRRLDRRTFLRGAAGATLALPWLESMGRADTLIAPRRLIVLWTGNGFSADHWRSPRVNPADPSDFTPSELHAEFGELLDVCTFVDGSWYHSRDDPRSCAGAHQGGCQAALTGSWSSRQDGGNQAGVADGCPGAGPAVSDSIDVALGRHLEGQTKFPVYRFKAGNAKVATTSCPFVRADAPFDAGGTMLGSDGSPQGAFDSLFADLELPGPGPEPTYRRRELLVEHTLEDYERLRCEVGASDRVRLEQHLDALVELERDIQTPTTVTDSCQIPGDPGISEGAMPAVAAQQIRLLSQALACDLTRVATLQLGSGGTPSTETYDWLGHNNNHHALSHDGDEGAIALTEINRWHISQIKQLVAELQALPEGDGSVFDSTVIFWASELGDFRGHSKRAMFTLIGRGAGYFAGGRYLEFSTAQSDAHNRMLMHLMHYMGHEVESFGAPEYCQGGPLPGLT